MKQRLTLVMLLLFVAIGSSFAQKYTATTLYRFGGQEVFDLDSADYIQVVTAPDSGSNLYNVEQYYKNKTRKLIAKSKERLDIAYEGQVQTFYPTGKKQELVTYVNGAKQGEDYLYYPNGKLYLHRRYLSEKDKIAGNDVLIMDCRDSTGTSLATEGNGTYKGYGPNFAFLFEEGPIKDGLRDGEFKGTNGDKEHNLTFTEQYEKGALKSGKALYADDNKTYDYTSRYVQPQYPGGERAFNRYIDDKVVYPENLRATRTQGRVIVQFVVMPDGSLAEPKIIYSPDRLFSDAAIKVVLASPKWTPGSAFGRAVKVPNNVAVNFRL